MSQEIRTAIVPIAGFGSRMAPLSHAIPKDFLPVGMKPVIQHSVEELIEAGFNNIILAIKFRNIPTYIEHFMPAPYFFEKNTPAALRSVKAKALYKHLTFCPISENSKGSGDTLLQAKRFIPINEPFFVFFPDDLIVTHNCLNASAQLLEQYKEHGRPKILIASMPVAEQKATQYGIFQYGIGSRPFDRYSKVMGIIEKPNPPCLPSKDAVIGRFILPYEVILKLECILYRQQRFFKELSIIDAIQVLIEEGLQAYRYYFTGIRFDCGDPTEYLKAVHHFSSPAGIKSLSE